MLIKPLFLAVAVVTLLVFLPAAGHDFINFDDPYYVTGNEIVRRGLTLSGLRWACTTLDYGNWHPFTWLSHMLDVELFGPIPAGHHVHNVLLHAINAGLLSLVLFQLTGRRWESSLVGVLFGLHPLHVESVAWISERKDLLSTFFGLLALLAYTLHLRCKRRGNLALTTVLFVCGFMAKPMLLTLPLLLLILDFWPLGRLRGERLPALIREKTPLLCLTAAAGTLTYYAQIRAGAVAEDQAIPLLQRAGNALLSYATYAWKMLWPSPLSVFYPLGGGPSAVGKTLAAGALLAGITILAVRTRIRRPALLAGWLWYLVTLLPVVGLVQVGGQVMADRYTYFTLNGLFVALIWGVAGPAVNTHPRRFVVGAAALAVTAALALATHQQLSYWQNSRTLFSHTLEAGVVSWRAHAHLAAALMEEGAILEAARHYREAARLAPLVPQVRVNLGVLLLRMGQADEALPHLAEAVRLQPQLAEAHYNLGLALRSLGRVEEASSHLRQARSLNPALGQ